MPRAVPSGIVRVHRKRLLAGIAVSASVAASSCSGAYAPVVGPATPAPTAAPVTVAPRAATRPASADSAATSPPPAIPQTAPPTALPTTAPPAGNAFTILVTGDLLSHTAVVDQARAYAAGEGYDFTPMLRDVRPIVTAADVAICHLETPVAPPGTPADGSYPDYGVPAQITAAIAAAGFDRCSLASNHAMDKGAAGVDSTLGAFDAAGLGHAGMARTAAEAGPTLFDVRGTTVAHLSYTFGFNGRRLPRDQPWRSNRIDPARIVADARQARRDGARFVLVSLHWGTEGSSDVTANQRRWAEEITASGAVDVIVGHHAHVVQPIEQVNGRWVVFGLGNFLTAMSGASPCCGIRGQDGMMVRLRAAEQPDGSFAVAKPEAIATYVDRSSYVVLPVQLGLTDAAFAGTVGTDALTDSLGRTASVVGSYLVPR
jgi:hypothetical protein